MDSVTQLALGAAVAVATLGRTNSSKLKAAIAGAVIGTLPDLDVLIDYGDVISNMVLHRAQSHALFYQTLLSPLLAYIAAMACKQRRYYLRWLLATWLVLITHTAIDAMTVYGTQLGLPFSNYPFAVGSIFIIDPLYTLPLLCGVSLCLLRQDSRAGLSANMAGLLLSTVYMGWTVLAQSYVTHIARNSFEHQQLNYQHMLVTPAPLNTLLWRIVVTTEQGYAEGFYSLLDAEPEIRLQHVIKDETLKQRYQHLTAVQQIAWFSRGFYSLDKQDDTLLLADLRMGQEGSYAFVFVLDLNNQQPLTQLPMRQSPGTVLPWLWRRILGQPVPSPYWLTEQ